MRRFGRKRFNEDFDDMYRGEVRGKWSVDVYFDIYHRHLVGSEFFNNIEDAKRFILKAVREGNWARINNTQTGVSRSIDSYAIHFEMDSEEGNDYLDWKFDETEHALYWFTIQWNGEGKKMRRRIREWSEKDYSNVFDDVITAINGHNGPFIEPINK